MTEPTCVRCGRPREQHTGVHQFCPIYATYWPRGEQRSAAPSRLPDGVDVPDLRAQLTAYQTELWAIGRIMGARVGEDSYDAAHRILDRLLLAEERLAALEGEARRLREAFPRVRRP